jgi:MYXO-CTERM domain-containing protein
VPVEHRTGGKVPRSTRVNLALTLMAIAIVLNLILLFAEDTSPGWPIAAVILLGAAGAALLSQRREP